MEGKKISRFWKTLAGAGAFAGSFLAGDALADEPLVCNTEARVENYSDEDGKDWFKSSLNISPTDFGCIAIDNYTGDDGNEKADWTSIGVRTPKFKVGGLESSAVFFGSDRDKRGFGLENTSTIGDFTIVGNAERDSLGGVNRLGVGADYKTGKWIFGTGVDNVSGDAEMNQYLLKAILGSSDTDRIGASMAWLNSGGELTKSLTGFLGHYNDDWGVRLYNNMKFADKVLSNSGELIVTQNPTFGTGSYDWIVGRARGEINSREITLNPLDPISVPYPDRNTTGAVGAVKWNYDHEKDSGSLTGEAGYDFGVGNSTTIGPTVSYSHGIGENDNRSVGAGVLLRTGIGKARVGLEVRGNKGIAGDNKNLEGYVGGSVSWGF